MCNRWVRYCALLLVEAPLSRGVRSFHKGSTQPGYLGTLVVSMLGLLVLLWHFIDASRTPEMLDYVRQLLVHAAQRATESSVMDDDVTCFGGPEGFFIAVRQGRIFGLADAMAKMHSQVRPTFQGCWSRLRDARIVSNGVMDDSHSVSDVVSFACMYLRDRRLVSHNLVSARAAQVVGMLHDYLRPWVSTQLQVYLEKIHVPHHNCSQLPPSRSVARMGSQRPYFNMVTEKIWTLIEKARLSGCSLRQVILTSTHPQEEPMANPSQADVWANKKQHMAYSLQRTLHGPNRWCIIADPATHNNKEVMAAVAYSWERGAGIYPAFQWVLPGQAMTPMDVDFELSVLTLAAIGRLQLVAAFCQLQALSHMAKQTTRHSLDEYHVPELHLRRVAAGKVRIATPRGVCLVNTTTREETKVLPDSLHDAPLLTVGLEQGSIGAVGVACAYQRMGCLVWTSYDKFHRVIRDIKLSLTYVARGVFLTCQLFTSFIWSLNYKPFNSGSFDSKLRCYFKHLCQVMPSSVLSVGVFVIVTPALALELYSSKSSAYWRCFWRQKMLVHPFPQVLGADWSGSPNSRCHGDVCV